MRRGLDHRIYAVLQLMKRWKTHLPLPFTVSPDGKGWGNERIHGNPAVADGLADLPGRSFPAFAGRGHGAGKVFPEGRPDGEVPVRRDSRGRQVAGADRGMSRRCFRGGLPVMPVGQCYGAYIPLSVSRGRAGVSRAPRTAQGELRSPRAPHKRDSLGADESPCLPIKGASCTKEVKNNPSCSFHPAAAR